MSLTQLSNELKAALAHRFPEGGVTSLENQEADTTIVASIEEWSPRARAILKQVTMGADGANMYLGHKAQSLAEKIAKLEEEIEEAKKVREAAKNAKPANESIEVDIEGASLEGWKGMKDGYKAGAAAFWKKDGKLSFPSMKRYHDWMETMQRDIDEKNAKAKELKAELKKLLEESKHEASQESDFSMEALSPRQRAIMKSYGFGHDHLSLFWRSKAVRLANKISDLEEEIELLKKARASASEIKPSNESIDEEVELSLEAHMSKEETKEFKKTFGSAGKAFWTKDGKLAFPSYKRLHDWLEQSQIDIDEKSAQVKALKEELKALKAESLKSSKESLDGGGLPTEPVKPKASEAAACADDKADAEGKTAPAVQSATPEHVSSQEGIEDGAAASAPVVDEAAVADPDGGEKIVQVAADHAPEQSAEDALVAVNDASAAIDGSMRESTELEDAAAGLESILSSIAEYPQGLSPKDAEFVNVNLESIVGDWGLTQKLCPSIESFGGTNLRREATASLEANVREVLKGVYDYVVEMFKKFGELIANFYMQLFNASKAVAQRGEALTQRVAAIQVDTPSKNVVDIGSTASRLTINGQMPSLTAAMGAVMQEIEAALELENHVQAIESAVGSAAAHLRGLKDDTFSAGYEEVSTAYLSATKAPPIFAANGEVLQTRVFPGEISYVAEQKEGHWRFRVVKTGKEPQGSVIHVPSKGDLGKLGERLKSEGQKAGDGIKGISERIKTDKGQRFLAQIQGPSNSLNDENQRAIAKFVQQCAEDVKAIHALGKEMLTNAAKSMLAIVKVGEISCDLYKAPKAEAAPAAAKPEGEAPAAPAPGEGGEAPAAA